MIRMIAILGSVLMVLSQSVWALVTIDHWQTKNGVQVSFVPTHALPIVDVAVSFKAGSAYDGQDWGLASMVAATLDTGTIHHSELEIAKQWDQLGVRYGQSVGRDRALFTLRSLNQPNVLWQAAIQLGELLTDATFPTKPWQRVRAEQLVNLKLASQQPDVVASWHLYKALYGKHPYAHPVDGVAKTVQALTPLMAKHFYEQYYVAKNAVVTIVGDINERQAHKLASLLTAGMPAGQAAKPLPAVMPLTHSKTIRVPVPSKQTTIMMASLGARANNPSAIALNLANYSLGGAGLTSLLSKQVREQQGLVYGVNSGLLSYTRKGLFVVAAQTRNSSANRAADLIQQTVANYLKTGPDAKQLMAAKDYVNGAFSVGLASNAALLEVINRWRFYHYPQNYLHTYLDRVQHTTLSEAQQALKQTIDWDHHVTVIVGGAQ